MANYQTLSESRIDLDTRLFTLEKSLEQFTDSFQVLGELLPVAMAINHKDGRNI